ncbi:MAG: fused response regulator/phosphatase [Pseudomonadota bacterium]|nr:fused response regulator/phosphatase [Pseudomonadota bacterium]
MSTALIPQILNSSILIVEDNEINRLFLEKALRAGGFNQLLSVASAEEALEKMNDFKPELIILDIMLPGMNGFECCETIRRQESYNDLPILIQTSMTEPELRVKAFAKGATDFVSKPVYPDELRARVMVHLEKRHSLKALQIYKARIETELEHARQLQQAILPSLEDITGIERQCQLDIDSYFHPSSEIGGDFWGMKNLFPHQAALWMVDFSGHGVAAALNAFRLQAHLKEYTTMAARPGEYLSHLNDKLLHLLLRGQFATMFYGIIDTQSNQLFYACACAPHPIILRSASGKAEQLDGSGVPLGIGLHLYYTQGIPFSPGDLLLLYSDAFIETPDANGTYISEKNIMALLEEHAGATAGTIRKKLLDYFCHHTGDALRDDLTLAICVRQKSRPL